MDNTGRTGHLRRSGSRWILNRSVGGDQTAAYAAYPTGTVVERVADGSRYFKFAHNAWIPADYQILDGHDRVDAFHTDAGMAAIAAMPTEFRVIA